MIDEPKDQAGKAPEGQPPLAPAAEEKPDSNITVPTYQYLTEGYDPDRLKKPKED